MQYPPDHTFQKPLLDSLRPVAASLQPPAHTTPAAPEQPRPDQRWARLRSWFALLAVGSFAAATAAAVPHEPEQAERRLAAPAVKTTESGNPTRWHDEEVVITLDPSLEELGPYALDAVRAAYGAWLATDAELPNARFVLAKNRARKPKRDGQNRVIAAPIDIPGHENDLAVTVSQVSSSGAILEADVVINTRHAFYGQDDACVHAYDLASVVTHEAGHFYGLGEDREDREATMYFETGRCETKKRSLSEPDVDTLAVLYEGGIGGEPLPGVGCSTAGPTPTSASFLAVVTALAAALVARRRRG